MPWAVLLGALIPLFPPRAGAGACVLLPQGPAPLTFAPVSVPLAVKDSLGREAGHKQECPSLGAVPYLSGLLLRKSLDSGRVYTAPGLRSARIRLFLPLVCERFELEQAPSPGSSGEPVSKPFVVLCTTCKQQRKLPEKCPKWKPQGRSLTAV